MRQSSHKFALTNFRARNLARDEMSGARQRKQRLGLHALLNARGGESWLKQSGGKGVSGEGALIFGAMAKYKNEEKR